MILDMRTIVIMLVVSSVLMAITLAVGTKMGRAAGFVKWNVGLGLLALGWVLVAARGALPDFVAVALADAILVAALCTELAGIIEFGAAADRSRTANACAADSAAARLCCRDALDGRCIGRDI